MGRGRAQPHSHAGTALPRQVSISSEVGRGRAPRCEGKGVQTQDDWFQSPRRWGGVGLVHLASPAQRLRLLSFNPLGGGAGSGSQSCPAQAGSGLEFQSPRRWGRARDRRGATTHRCEASFNPHGGGAGRAPGTCRRPWSKSRPAGFNPLGGGAGSGWSIWQALLNAFLLSFNPLGGGARSGFQSADDLRAVRENRRC